MSRRNELQRILDLIDAPKRIPRAVDKQAGSPQIWQMLNTELFRLAWRMEWIGEQQQARNQIGLLGAQHRSLTAPVGMSAKKYFPVVVLTIHARSHRGNRIAQASAVALSVAGKWRPEGFLLPKRKIAAQNRVAMSAESLSERNEQWCIAITARAVRQDQCVPARNIRSMHPAAYMRLNILIEE